MSENNNHVSSNNCIGVGGVVTGVGVGLGGGKKLSLDVPTIKISPNNSFTNINNNHLTSNNTNPSNYIRRKSTQLYHNLSQHSHNLLQKRMTRSTLFIFIKYSIFVNWTMTGFWIIYNSTDYSSNAQLISEKLSNTNGVDLTSLHATSASQEEDDSSHDGLRVEKASVVYGLIAYTIFTSFVSFFGLVGVCYENFYLTFGLACCYVVYTIVDSVFHLVMGVKFGSFLSIMYVLMVINALSLFFLSFMIRYTSLYANRHDYVASSDRDLSTIWQTRRDNLCVK